MTKIEIHSFGKENIMRRQEANESSVRLIDANALLRRIQEYIDSDLTSTEEKIGADYRIEFVQNAETVLKESEG